MYTVQLCEPLRCASDYSFTVRRQPLWRETLSDLMNTEQDSTKDITRFPAGNLDTMDGRRLAPTGIIENGVLVCSNTPTEPRASVGQPDTPSTASKKKTSLASLATGHRVGVRFPEGLKLLHFYTEFPA